MSKKRYEVELTSDERNHLKNLTSSGSENARKLTRARILLKADEGWQDEEIVQALDVSRPTVERIRMKYATGDLATVLERRPSSRAYERKLDGRGEAHLVALVCGSPPAGRSRWSLRLLSDELVKLEEVEIESVSHETIRQVLKKTNLSLGSVSSG
jgi:hypothetical protein